MMKSLFKKIIARNFGSSFYFLIETLYKKKFNLNHLKEVKIKQDNFKLNKKLLNNLNLDIKKINFVFKKNDLIYEDGYLSWHYHIFAGLSDSGLFNILEIGTHIGKFSNYLSTIFPYSKIITIDLPDKEMSETSPYYIDDKKKRQFFLDERKENLNSNNIEFLQFNSSELSKKFKTEYFDFIWVDGDHLDPQVSLDIDQSIYLCKKQGVICVDDIIRQEYKGETISNESFITLENYRKKNILDVCYFLKRITPDHSHKLKYKYIAYAIKK